jgi:hypothetical protein
MGAYVTRKKQKYSSGPERDTFQLQIFIILFFMRCSEIWTWVYVGLPTHTNHFILKIPKTPRTICWTLLLFKFYFQEKHQTDSELIKLNCTFLSLHGYEVFAYKHSTYQVNKRKNATFKKNTPKEKYLLLL